MSAAAPIAGLPRREPHHGRPLRAVAAPARRRKPKVAYAIIALSGALAIAGAQMVLSILTTQGTYELANLSQQQRQLTWQKQILADDVAGLGSPQYLAANATALGMVVAESPNYLRLSDGAILGTSALSTPGASVDALGRAAVGNSLIATTPLVTDPAATIGGAILPAGGEAAGADPATPPALTDGLPIPRTH